MGWVGWGGVGGLWVWLGGFVGGWVGIYIIWLCLQSYTSFGFGEKGVAGVIDVIWLCLSLRQSYTTYLQIRIRVIGSLVIGLSVKKINYWVAR